MQLHFVGWRSFSLLRERYWDETCHNSDDLAVNGSFSLLRERYWDTPRIPKTSFSSVVHLVYCESGIETGTGALRSWWYRRVHLVYCESGIETLWILGAGRNRKKVHLVYCESGIETELQPPVCRLLCCSFSLLRERYWDKNDMLSRIFLDSFI